MKTTTRRRFLRFNRKDVFELFICIALAGLFVLLSSGKAFSQGNVGINNPTPHAKSLLDLTSSDKGLLTPRLTAAQRTAMFPAPDATAKGMLVYQTDGTQGYYYYDGAAWQMLQAGGAGWGLLGNAGTNVATNFLGTTDNTSVGFRTNNVERMRLSYTGNLSLGAAIDPVNYRLYVENNAPNHGVLLANTNAAAWAGINCQSNQGAVSQLGVGNSGSGIWANLGYVGTRTNHDFTLITNEIDRVRITAAGLVGIGTSAPGRKLHVVDDGVGIVTAFQGTNPNGYSISHWLRSDNVGAHVGFFNPGVGGSLAGNFVAGTYGSAPMSLTTNNLERVHITAAGNVGIGTNTPVRMVELASANQAIQRISSNNAVFGSVIELNNTTTGNNGIGAFNFLDNGSVLGQLMYHKTDGMTFRTANAERMRVDVNGNVGIGTTAPQVKLDVVDGNWLIPMRVRNTLPTGYSAVQYINNNNKFGNIGWGNSASATFADKFYVGTTSAEPLLFTTADVERARIDASGNVGIGTSTPTTKLHVEAALPGANLMRMRNTDPTGWSGIDMDNPTSTARAFFGMHNQTGIGFAGTGTANPFCIYTTGLPRLHVSATGSVGVNTQAPTAELEVNGFTKHGTNAPAIKQVEFTGTTAATEGAFVDIVHGLTASKIIDVRVLIEYTAGNWITTGYAINPEYLADYVIGATNIRIYNHNGSSGSILSKPVKILVTYKA